METRELLIDRYNPIPCYLVSSVFGHCDAGLEIITHCGSESETFAINKSEAKEIMKIIVEHFNKRCLTDDEVDVIARLI